VLSTDDLHLRHGSIVFGVQTAAGGAAAATPDYAPQPFEVIARWIDFVALASLIGALALMLLTLPASIDATLTASTERRLLTLAVFAAGAALITSSGGVVGQAVTLSSGSVTGLSAIDAAMQLLTQTEYGSRWLMREGWTIALLAILVWQRRQVPVNRLVLGATLPLIGGLAVLQAMNGHATSFTDTSLVRIAADALHLLGAGVWVGGLIALTIAIAPVLRRADAARRTDAALARSILQRFGLLASASLGVLIVTGLYNSGQQVASLDALLFTLYGQALLLKIGLVLIVGLIGLLNSARLHPQVGAIVSRIIRRPIESPRHLGRTVTLEAIGAIGVLLIVAVLGSSQPARGPEFDPPAEDTTLQTVSTNVEALFMTFSIKPNRPGQNFISIGAFNTRRPAPAPIEKVTVRFTPPDGAAGFDLNADLIGKEKYQITGDAINSPGDWQMTIQAQRPGLPTATWTFPWNVMPASALSARPVKVSNQPIEPWLNLAAGLGGLIGVGGGLAVWRRMRPARSPSHASIRETQSLKAG
jgi:copper transport protein